MARDVRRGEIWMYQFSHPDKKRPVLILTRDSAIPYLHDVTVAPITSTIRDIPTEISVGAEEGLKRPSAVNFDHLQTISKEKLKTFVGSLDHEKLEGAWKAVSFALGF